MNLLVTGFGPFPGVETNPSAAVAEALGAAFPGAVAAHVLPTEWRVCEDIPELARRARTVLMFGVSARARCIRYERLAWPEACALPDAAGALPRGAPLHSRRSALDVPGLVAAARRTGAEVALSSDPGRYICNAAYAAALGAKPRTLFVHVPLPGPRGLAPLVDHAAWLAQRLSGPARIAGLAGC